MDQRMEKFYEVRVHIFERQQTHSTKIVEWMFYSTKYHSQCSPFTTDNTIHWLLTWLLGQRLNNILFLNVFCVTAAMTSTTTTMHYFVLHLANESCVVYVFCTLHTRAHTHCPHFLGIQFRVQNYVRGQQLTSTNHCNCTAGYRRALHFDRLYVSEHSFSFKQNLSISKYVLKMIKTNAMQNLPFKFNFIFIFDNFNMNEFNVCRSRMARSHTHFWSEHLIIIYKKRCVRERERSLRVSHSPFNKTPFKHFFCPILKCEISSLIIPPLSICRIHQFKQIQWNYHHRWRNPNWTE